MASVGIRQFETPRIGIARIVIGLLQGVSVYLLLVAFEGNIWPASMPLLYGALFGLAINVPLITTSTLGHSPLRDTIAWTIIAAVICGLQGLYAVSITPLTPPTGMLGIWRLQYGFVWSFQLACALFVAHCLVTAAIHGKRPIASYRTYFDLAWKYSLQAAMAVLFTGILWLLLWLGATLFGLIKITVFTTWIEERWFYIPVTAVAVHTALHLTDQRAGLIKGLRSISCNLLGWLLPLLTVIVTGFLAALPFTGLQPLWATRYAAAIVLTAAAALIFLINAVYQDGERYSASDPDAGLSSRLLRIAVTVASMAMLPLVSIASYGLLLRIAQHGWTPQRVLAVACSIVAAYYGMGYAWAAVRQTTTRRAIAATNIIGGFIIVATFTALISPIAHPFRISVNNQVARLMSGAVSPEAFDYALLRKTGNYGREQLQKLADQKDIAFAAQRAEALLKSSVISRPPPPTDDQITKNITVISPFGATLPPRFVETARHFPSSPYALPDCLRVAVKCEAVLRDLTGTGTTDVLIFPVIGAAGVFQFRDGSGWTYTGVLSGSHCPTIRNALRSGHASLVEPTLKDVSVAGLSMRIIPHVDCGSLTKG